MTSRAEACPNTVLEAMAHGAVSISTDQQPMPEFYGESAAYYRATDAAQLASQIEGGKGSFPPADRTLRRQAARDRGPALHLGADGRGDRRRAPAGAFSEQPPAPAVGAEPSTTAPSRPSLPRMLPTD